MILLHNMFSLAKRICWFALLFLISLFRSVEPWEREYRDPSPARDERGWARNGFFQVSRSQVRILEKISRDEKKVAQRLSKIGGKKAIKMKH